MAFKIKLNDENNRLPDFKMKVAFNMVNGEENEIVFTVKHRTSEEIQALYSREGVKDSAFILEIASGWDLEDEFNEANARKLVTLFPAIGIALPREYMAALAGVRAKN